MTSTGPFKGGLMVCLAATCGCSSFIKSTHAVFPAAFALANCSSKGFVGSDPEPDAGSLLIAPQESAALSQLITADSIFPSLEPRTADPRNAATIASARAAAVSSAKDALKVISSPTHQKLLAMIALGLKSPIQGLSHKMVAVLQASKGADPELKIDKDEWIAYSSLVAQVSLTDGWSTLSAASRAVGNCTAGETVSTPTCAVATESDFIAKYVAAYFRQGHLVALTMDPGSMESDLKKRVDSWVSDAKATAAQPTVDTTVDQLLQETLPSSCKKSAASGKWPASCNILGSVGDTGFVARGGDKYAFPALNFVADPLGQQKLQKPQVDLSKVGADLVRVVVEATGDALARVPAVQGSTACAAGLLECFDPLKKGAMTADNFAKVTQYGAMSEAVMAQATGMLVRGGSVFALNNEALAQAIETGVSVAARKSAEKVAWDYLSCAAGSKEFQAVAVNVVGYRPITIAVK